MTKIGTAFFSVASLVAGLAIGLWASDIKAAEAPTLLFLIFLAALMLKVFMDDLVHFSSEENQGPKAARGFAYSLAMWLLFFVTFGLAINYLHAAVFCLIVAFLIATIWIAVNYIDIPSSAGQGRQRHVGWVAMNSMYIGGLALFLAFDAVWPSIISIILFALLALLVVGDAIFFGTIGRLASADRAGPTPVETPGHRSAASTK